MADGTVGTADRVELVAYAGLAVAGLVWPWWHNLAFFAEHGWDGGAGPFLAEAFSTSAGASLTADLAVACAAWLVWMWGEARQLGRRPWVWVVLALGVAFAFACPLFLFLRKRQLLAER